MTFRSMASIDNNSQKGLILLNSISGSPLVATGLSLTNAQPIHVAIVDTAGSQVVPAASGGTGDINLKQVNGQTVNVGIGTAGTGTARVAVSSDSSIVLAAGAATIGALTANQSVNVSQINGVAATMGNGVSGTGVQRMTLASDSTGNIATIGTSVTPGTAATNLGKAEDAAHVSGDTGVFNLAVRNNTASALAGTDGDYIPFTTGTNGEIWVGLATKLDSQDSITIAGGLMPAATALNTYAVRITTNTTTTPTSSTAYISSIVITTEVGGTTSTVTIRDKQGTPQVLVNGLTTTAASLSPTVINFQTPVKMTSGIDIVTAGAVAGTVDIWINYYQ